ncbi:MAG: ROK family protein, partial [Bacilli bacterium]
MKKYLCIDIGGTAIKYGLLQEDYVIIKSFAINYAPASKDKLVRILNKLVLEHEYDGIAISSAGVIDPYSGQVISASDNIKDYQGFNIVSYLKEYLIKHKGLNIPISIENDVNCVGLAQTTISKYQNMPLFVMALGTGIGSCLINNNTLYHGHNYAAGEVGYFSIGSDYFENVASTSALVKQVQVLKNNPNLNGHDVFSLLKQQDLDVI